MTDLTTPARNTLSRRTAEAGLSLIEVMISMVLALITFLIMFQMFESWDRNKRTTASGGGAMVTGALALFRLERDLHLAGFGFGNASELGCTVRSYYSSRPDEAASASGAVSATVSNVYSFPLVPLQIINGTGGTPDQLVILYGSSEGVSATRFFGTNAAGAQLYTAATSTTATMDIGARAGIQQGDLVVLSDGTVCNLVEATINSNSDRRTFEFTTANYTHFYTGTANTTPRFNNPTGATVGPTGNAYVLGPRPQRRIWQIRNNRTLAFSNDFWTDNVNNTTLAAGADGVNDVPFTDIADNIVNLQAEYGYTGTLAGTTCSASNPPTWSANAPGANCLWPFIWAVRVALLARSDQFEKAVVTTAAPTWAGGANAFVMTNLDGTAEAIVPTDPTQDWRHYRYKVFESIIPLKNVMWASR